MDRLRVLVSTFEDLQKDRIRLEGRIRSLGTQMKETYFEELARDVRSLEESVAKEIAVELEGDPIYTAYLKRIKGVGPVLAGYLIAYLCRPRVAKIWRKSRSVELPKYAKVLEEKKDYVVVELPPVCEVAGNPSKLHKYAGLAPGSKLSRGERVGYNPKVKTLMWKILMQFLKAGAKTRCKYAELFNQVKQEYAQRCPKPEKGSWKLKVHLTSKNIVMRIFLTNLWITYRQINGLPLTSPYPAKLGEQHKIYKPEELLDE